MMRLLAQTPIDSAVQDSSPAPVSVERLMTLDGPLSPQQLIWLAAGLLGLLALLSIRDAMLARKKWVVPLLLVLRLAACAGVIFALAAPTSTTRKTFETRRGIGIYMDTSASMGLRDAADGEGHMARWDLAAQSGTSASRSPLVALDRAAARIDVALALVGSASRSDRQTRATLALLDQQVQAAVTELEKHASQLPYPSLGEDVRQGLREASESGIASLLERLPANAEDAGLARGQVFVADLDTLRLDIAEMQNRLAVISRALARQEDLQQSPPANLADNETPTRLERARRLLGRLESETLASSGEDLDVRRSTFSEQPRIADADWKLIADAFPAPPPAGSFPDDQTSETVLAEQPVTDLNAVLREIANQYRDGRIDAAVVITDGVHNHPEAPLEIPLELASFPLLVVPSGGDFQLDDVALWRATAPTTLMRGDFLSVDCLVGARGYAGQSTQVRLLENGEVRDAVDVTFTADDGDQEVRLTTPVNESGFRRFEVEVVPLDEELHTENNRQSIAVDVFSGDLKVLLADGLPRWETRYLSNLLKRDTTTEHREIIFAPDPPDPLPATLSDPEALADFNVVVIGEIDPGFLGFDQLNALERYVDEGGNLIVIAGREQMPGAFTNTMLEEILPVRLDIQREVQPLGLQLAPSTAGRRVAALSLEDDDDQNAAVWKLGSTRLPLTELSSFNVPKPGAQVILEARPITDGEASQPEESSNENGEAMPYIVWHRYGAGRVFYLPSPTTYYLRYRYGDRYHYRFWGQFLRWATTAEMQGGSAFVQISSEAKHYRENDTPRIEVELRDTDGNPLKGTEVAIELERHGIKIGSYPAAEVVGSDGHYTVTLPALSHGDYRVRVIGDAVDHLLTTIQVDNDADGQDSEAADARPLNESGFIVEAKPSSEAGAWTCDWDTVQRLALSTAGAVVPPDGLGAAIEVLTLEGAKRHREEITRVPLWDRWPLFFFILIFLSVEWIGRKYAGLI